MCAVKVRMLCPDMGEVNRRCPVCGMHLTVYVGIPQVTIEKRMTQRMLMGCMRCAIMVPGEAVQEDVSVRDYAEAVLPCVIHTIRRAPRKWTDDFEADKTRFISRTAIASARPTDTIRHRLARTEPSARLGLIMRCVILGAVRYQRNAR